MPNYRTISMAALALSCALAGCGERSAEPAPELQPDPAIVAALSAPIMTDPDLAALNRGNAAIALDRFDAVPAWTRDPEQVEASRRAAAELAGGELRPAPEAKSDRPLPTVASARQFASQAGEADDRCREALRQSFAWASDMPKAVRLYPGGHAVEAVGARLPVCALRAVRYVTAASPKDVLDFHFTMLAAAGYQVARASDDGADLLTAGKGRANARVQISSGADGMTEVAVAISA
jgi:hypothetical protein